MSDHDESEGKITPLFPSSSTPSHTEDASQSSPDAPDELDEELDEIDASTEEPDDENDENSDTGDREEAPGDNVVRVQFGAKPTATTPPAPALDELAPADQAKFKIFSTIIDEGMVMVTLNPAHPEATIPPQFQGSPELRLNFCHQFQIPDFSYDPGGVRASLSFQGVRHFCEIPWEAVLMLYSHASGEAYLFDPDAPTD